MIDIDVFVLPEELFHEIILHAKKNSPNESVSMISGRIEGKQARAEEVYLPENADHSTVTFSVEPKELLAIYTDIEEKGRQLVGIYHTHPAAAYPSGTDKAYMEVNPVVWLIASITSPDKPKGFILLENSAFKDIKLIIV